MVCSTGVLAGQHAQAPFVRRGFRSYRRSRPATLKIKPAKDGDPLKIIKKPTHIVWVHTLDQPVAAEKPRAKHGPLSALCTIQSVPLYGIFASLARAKVSMPEKLADQICKILANINVIPQATFHGDPNHCCLWDMRCLRLINQADKRQVERLARYLRELGGTVCTKTKSSGEMAPPMDER